MVSKPLTKSYQEIIDVYDYLSEKELKVFIMSWLNNNFPNDKKMLIKKKKINTIENEHSALDLIKKSIENPSIRHDKRLKELEDGV